MKKERLFAQYLRQRRGILSAFALMATLLSISFWLYELPLEAVLYPMALCLLLGGGILTADYLRVRRQHKMMRQVTELTEDTLHQLPERTIEDRDWYRLLEQMCRRQGALEGEMSTRYENMVDYYTLWAHQIKTPIASMSLTLQNEDTPLSRQLTSDLLRVEQYVEMALMFLRLDGDTMDYVVREYALDDILRQAVRKFAGEFIRRRIRLDFTPTNYRVITDDKWLCFVVEQLLSNALKYTAAGSIAICMETPGVLCIRDTGMGIAPEDLPRIFEKGYTGCNGRTDKRASGIGLYLCRRICDHLGHTISASSVPGEGTELCLGLSQRELPLE